MDKTEELLQKLESTANFMRGMQFDLRIPSDTRWALLKRAEEIDKLVQENLED